MWVLTYGDMMSLLLCFFILLVSFADMDRRKVEAAMGSLRDAFGGVPDYKQVNSLPGIEMLAMEFQQDVNIIHLEEKLRRLFAEEMDQNKIVIQEQTDGLNIRIYANALFLPNNPTGIQPEMGIKLATMGELMIEYPNITRVTGHTSTTEPPAEAPFAHNWLLSGMQAVAVVNHLLANTKMDPRQFESRALASLLPIADNESEEGKNKNHRVEILVSHQTRDTKENQEDRNEESR